MQNAHILIEDEPSKSEARNGFHNKPETENVPPHHFNTHQIIYLWLCRSGCRRVGRAIDLYQILELMLSFRLTRVMCSLFITSLIIADVVGVKLFAFSLPFEVTIQFSRCTSFLGILTLMISLTDGVAFRY